MRHLPNSTFALRNPFAHRRLRCLAAALWLSIAVEYSPAGAQLPPPRYQSSTSEPEPRSSVLRQPVESADSQYHTADSQAAGPDVMPRRGPVLNRNFVPGWLSGWSPSGLSTRMTLLPGSGDDLGQTELRFGAGMRRALPASRSMVSITPSFSMQLLDGPNISDLPDQLYRVSVSGSWMKQLNERTAVVLGISPGMNTDFENTGSDAIRLMGFASGTWQYNPAWQLQFGVAFLGRSDLPVLPVAGLVWTPDEDTRIELAAPRPRFARRIVRDGTGLFAGDQWVYFAGEFGGGTWAIQRASGADDEVTLRDFRVLVGFETKNPGGPNWQVETGYVFGRTIEYDSNTPDIEPASTVMFRGGVSY